MIDDFIIPRTATSTNSYATVCKVNDLHSRNILVSIKENNVNAIKYKILGSLDDVTYHELQAETVVTKNGSGYKSFSDAWRFIDVQIASNVAETHGNATVVISGL